jgi:asparagine synthase (glutamine-hydrolysing)
MCGILGVAGDSLNHNLIRSALDTMSDRGPDGSGLVDCGEIVLAHRRLSIIDLSGNASQPMKSSSGRFTVTFNGEIYNYREVARELNMPLPTYSSDTKVLLESIDTIGIEKTLQKIRGMYAIAVWDNELQSLFLIRDRVGVKPLYFGWLEKQFAFASTLKPFQLLYRKELSISSQAVADFFHYTNVPAPYSIYKNVFKLLPGAMLVLKKSEFHQMPDWFNVDSPTSDRYHLYWSVKEASVKAKKNIFTGDFKEAVTEFTQRFRESVKLRMVADVPLGVFLSGGIDSAFLASVMQNESISPIKTFTVGSQNPEFNEAPAAKSISDFLGTDHCEIESLESEILQLIPNLTHIWDEPFSDSSQIPTFLVSKLARKKVTVALSGDGGDELSLGYTRYLTARSIWPPLALIPLCIRNPLARTFGKLPLGLLNKILPYSSGQGRSRTSLGARLERFLPIIGASDKIEFAHILASHWSDSPTFDGMKARIPVELESNDNYKDFSIAETMAIFDMRTYLPDDLLTKVDRASMANSLEAREPYLDHPLIEFTLSLPEEYRASGGIGKKLIKEAAKQYIPWELLDRPKTGFSMPIGDWLRGFLRPWCEELLSRAALKKSGFINEKTVTKLWLAHVQGKSDYSLCLWDVLIFQSWYFNISFSNNA